MTEEAVSDLSLDTLFDLMIQTFKELLEAEQNGKGNGIANSKRKEIELLQRVILAKTEKLQLVDILMQNIFSN